MLAFAAAWMLLAGANPLAAAVTITFYSKELGATFPHAFVTMYGTLDGSGERVDVDYGFTAKAVTPAILMGKVGGEVISNHGSNYIKASDKHFSLVLSDEEYSRVIGTIVRWRKWPQPSYDLKSHNCVHFVAEIAASLGMAVDTPKGLMKKPRSFLERLTEMNRSWLVAHHALFHRPAAQASGQTH